MPPNPEQPSRLRTRLQALVRELGKFGTVGIIAFSIDLAIFSVVRGAGVEPLLAKTISTVVATTVAFFGNRYWTWRDGQHTHMARQYTLFFVMNAIGLGIALLCLAISHYGLGRIWPVFESQIADTLSGQFVGTALGTLFRFWSYRRFVFRVTGDPAPDGAVTAASPPDRDATSPSPSTH
ncbi:membrane protein [Actinoplanes sp. OR16]|uniref:GtrA family protein n=1 Tax=Actinoplanes sp. OR16 TaxID=946334 RepID=UPI000F711195|nr:GtrA family protein [Actinoplanes sp. OR16]BBH64751.1 membrane protein [Actinoplanes sp. OR16]